MVVERFGDFRDLRIWQQCRDIRGRIWEMTRAFPREETYRLVDQMVRASRSAGNCIAEGYGRFHYQENIQFCRHSRGSLTELIDHVLIAQECHYIDPPTHDSLITDIKSTIKSINSYIKYLQNEKNNTSNLKG